MRLERFIFFIPRLIIVRAKGVNFANSRTRRLDTSKTDLPHPNPRIHINCLNCLLLTVLRLRFWCFLNVAIWLLAVFFPCCVWLVILRLYLVDPTQNFNHLVGKEGPFCFFFGVIDWLVGCVVCVQVHKIIT